MSESDEGQDRPAEEDLTKSETPSERAEVQLEKGKLKFGATMNPDGTLCRGFVTVLLTGTGIGWAYALHSMTGTTSTLLLTIAFFTALSVFVVVSFVSAAFIRYRHRCTARLRAREPSE